MKSTYCGKTEADDRKLKLSREAPIPMLEDLYRIAVDGGVSVKKSTFLDMYHCGATLTILRTWPFSY